MQEYVLRGYTEHVCLNSFPSDYFRQDEAEAFNEYFGDLSGVGIVEILEYPYVSEEACMLKREACYKQDLQIAIDDYGSGISNMDLVDLCDPEIVKLDRNLISDIDKDPDKQDEVSGLVEMFHSRSIRVVGEGIETREEFDFLRGLGIDYYHILKSNYSVT